MYIVPSDIFVSYKLVPEVRMSYKFATSQLCYEWQAVRRTNASRSWLGLDDHLAAGRR